jgi:hypothetical protein
VQTSQDKKGIKFFFVKNLFANTKGCFWRLATGDW